MSLRRFVTLRWLRMDYACEPAINDFIAKYGKGGKPTIHETVKACWKIARRDWVWWILDGVLPPDLFNQWHWKGGDRRTDIRFALLYQRLADAQGKKKRKGKR